MIGWFRWSSPLSRHEAKYHKHKYGLPVALNARHEPILECPGWFLHRCSHPNCWFPTTGKSFWQRNRPTRRGKYATEHSRYGPIQSLSYGHSCLWTDYSTPLSHSRWKQSVLLTNNAWWNYLSSGYPDSFLGSFSEWHCAFRSSHIHPGVVCKEKIQSWHRNLRVGFLWFS